MEATCWHFHSRSLGVWRAFSSMMVWACRCRCSLEPSLCCVVMGSDDAFDSKLNRSTRAPAAMHHRPSGVRRSSNCAAPTPFRLFPYAPVKFSSDRMNSMQRNCLVPEHVLFGRDHLCRQMQYTSSSGRWCRSCNLTLKRVRKKLQCVRQKFRRKIMKGFHF